MERNPPLPAASSSQSYRSKLLQMFSQFRIPDQNNSDTSESFVDCEEDFVPDERQKTPETDEVTQSVFPRVQKPQQESGSGFGGQIQNPTSESDWIAVHHQPPGSSIEPNQEVTTIPPVKSYGSTKALKSARWHIGCIVKENDENQASAATGKACCCIRGLEMDQQRTIVIEILDQLLTTRRSAAQRNLNQLMLRLATSNCVKQEQLAEGFGEVMSWQPYLTSAQRQLIVDCAAPMLIEPGVHHLTLKRFQRILVWIPEQKGFYQTALKNWIRTHPELVTEKVRQILLGRDKEWQGYLIDKSNLPLNPTNTTPIPSGSNVQRNSPVASLAQSARTAPADEATVMMEIMAIGEKLSPQNRTVLGRQLMGGSTNEAVLRTQKLGLDAAIQKVVESQVMLNTVQEQASDLAHVGIELLKRTAAMEESVKLCKENMARDLAALRQLL